MTLGADPGGNTEAVLARVKEINKNTGAMSFKRAYVLVVKLSMPGLSLNEEVEI